MSDTTKQKAPREPKTPMNPDTRNRIILYSALGAVVVLGGGFLLMHGKGAGTDDAGTAAPVPVHQSTVPTLPAAAPSASAVPSFSSAKLRNPFVVPAALASVAGAVAGSAQASGSAVPSGAVGSLSPAEIAQLNAAGYNVTPVGSGTPVPGASSSANGSSAPTSSNWLQVLAGHKQSDGSWTVDVRSATGTKKGVKVGATKVGGTVLTYQGEDDELGVQTYVFTTSSGAGANVVANSKVAPYTGTLTSQNRGSTLVLSGGALAGGIF